MSRYIDADKMLEICTKYVASVFPDSYKSAKQDAELLVAIEEAEHKTIDIVRCKECASYCGDGNKCLWGLLTVDMGYCHHGYRGGDCITKQTEREDE